MKVKSISDLNINVFDEDDWDFFSSVDDAESYLNAVDKGLEYDRRTLKRKIIDMLRTIGMWVVIVFLVFIILFFVVAFTVGVMSKIWNQKADSNIVAAPSSTTLARVDGVEVDNDTIQGVSSTLSTYFDVLNAEKGYSNLDNFCVENSVFALLEETYRTSSTESYDSEDCSARALRAFGGCCSLVKIVDVIEKDGIYYCYALVDAPDLSELTTYYRKYNYDMMKYFTATDLSTMSVTRFMLGVVANGDIPIRRSEWLFELKYKDGMYQIIDDSQVSDYCTQVYNASIDRVVTLIGGTLVTNTHN